MALADQYMPSNLEPAEKVLWRSVFNSVLADTGSPVKAMCAAQGTFARSYLGMTVKSLVSGDFVSGWAVKFGSSLARDRADPPNFFSKRTNFMLDAYDRIPALWHHSGEIVGERSSYSVHNFGIWVSTKLYDGRRKSHILERVRRGELGYSTGSLLHLVEKGYIASTGEITLWPMAEISILPTSAIAEPGLGNLVIDNESAPAKADMRLEAAIKATIAKYDKENKRV